MLREINNSNFQSFLYCFERTIIDSIINNNEYELEMNKKEIISQEKLLELLFYRWEKGWIEINLKNRLKEQFQIQIFPIPIRLTKIQILMIS